MRRALLGRLWLVLLVLALWPDLAAAARPKGKDATADTAPAVDAAPAASSGEADVAPTPAGSAPAPPPDPPPPPTPAAAASAPASASARPAPSASAAPHGPDGADDAVVHIRDRKILSLHVPRGGQSAAQRAASASQALERAVNNSEARDVRVDQSGDVAVVFLGDTPVLQLGPDDAAANGDASLGVHAAEVASKLQSAVTAERNRKAYSTTALSISALVCSALAVFFLLGKIGGAANQLRAWIEEHPDRLPNVRVAGIDVIRPAAFRGGLLVAIDAAKWVLRLGAAYGWILFVLSLFDSTRVYSERLTGFVLAPLSALMGRLASALPLLIVGAIAGLAVVLLVRFVALFFGSVTRGETSLPWLPSDLARPTSVLVRAGIVLVAITLAAPLVTGTEEGAIGRAGAIALIALGLSVTPLLASAAVGVAVVFGRRLTVGDYAEVGGKDGRVRALSLLEVSLEDGAGCEVRVPHLASLLHPTRVLGKRPPVSVELTVAPGRTVADVSEILAREAARLAPTYSVDLVWVDADGAGYTVVVFSDDRKIRTRLLAALTEALDAAGVGLGKGRGLRATS